MKVHPDSPFKIVFPLFYHNFLGYLFESYVVQLDPDGGFSLLYQNISTLNYKEFAHGLDATDIELIHLTDGMQQEAIFQQYCKKKQTANEFFLKLYDPGNTSKGDAELKVQINDYVQRRMAKALPMMVGKNVFEMRNDGHPAGNPLKVLPKQTEVLFQFEKTTLGTIYSANFTYEGKPLKYGLTGGIPLCQEPPFILKHGKIYWFEKELEAAKLKPFLSKETVTIPQKMEEEYYKKFVLSLVAQHKVVAKGFSINEYSVEPFPKLYFREELTSRTLSLLPEAKQEDTSVADQDNEDRLIFELKFSYSGKDFTSDSHLKTNVFLEHKDGNFKFDKIVRDIAFEKKVAEFLRRNGLELKHGKKAMPKGEAMEWINNFQTLENPYGLILVQPETGGKKFFLGKPSFDLKIKEGIDWFDIQSIIRFGEFEIPFLKLRKYILKKQREFTLPNGEIAVIPDEWFTQFGDLLAFANATDEEHEHLTLAKHHIALVDELGRGNLAQVSLDQKLEGLRDFQKIEPTELPQAFLGELRPYQKAGYDWMMFLNQYKFGGCLADDMGLGKTVQTLALLQKQVELYPGRTSLLILPTSLVYNWEREAAKFTPNMKVFNYTGPYRDKDISKFRDYDLVITSYGTTRSDIELLEKFYFHYVILDESQAIKNPSSIIARAVLQLKAAHRLILTGTPMENSTLDLWSQMNFANPGLLGIQAYFKNEYLNPIEKHGDDKRLHRLHSQIKPFILRRNKSQVATELPEKVENVQYCTMSEEQEKLYEETKSYYRNQIMDLVEKDGINRTKIFMLKGLTYLRQLANHPAMVQPDYLGNSGKLDDVLFKLEDIVSEGHKVLIFSSFVRHLTILRNALDRLQLRYAYLDGGTKDREAEVQKFQTQEEVKIFLISLKAGGTGLNLTAASYVFMLDPWWNPAVEAQAIDRAHRIGQDKTVFIYRFISRGTVEEKIMAMQQRKRELASELITTEESFVKNLTEADIEELLA